MEVIISLLSLVPIIATLVYSIAKRILPLLGWLRGILFGQGGMESTVFRSSLFAVFLSLFIFLGGFGFIVIVGFKFSLEKFSFMIDILMSPFSALISSLLSFTLAASGGCPSMPSMFSTLLGVMRLEVFIGIIASSICCEVWLRFFIRNFLKPGVS